MKSQKIIISLSLLAFSVYLNSPVFAVEGVNGSQYRDVKQGVKTMITPNTTPVKQMMQENRQLIKQERTDLKATMGANREELSSTVLENMVNMLTTRVSNATTRLSKRADLLDTITIKIEERLSAIEIENGVTLTEPRNLISQAKTEMINARALIAAIKIDSTVTTKEELETQRASLKNQVEVAYQSLKKVSDLLRKSLNSAYAKNITLKPKSTITPKVRPSDGAGRIVPVPTLYSDQ